MDFLILLVALVVPNIPDPQLASLRMGELAAKIITMFFGFEVLLGELRGQYGRLVVGIIVGLGIIAVRAVV